MDAAGCRSKSRKSRFHIGQLRQSWIMRLVVDSKPKRYIPCWTFISTTQPWTHELLISHRFSEESEEVWWGHLWGAPVPVPMAVPSANHQTWRAGKSPNWMEVLMGKSPINGHFIGDFPIKPLNGGFHKWGYPEIDGFRMEYPSKNGWQGGTPISGNRLMDRQCTWL